MKNENIILIVRNNLIELREDKNNGENSL